MTRKSWKRLLFIAGVLAINYSAHAVNWTKFRGTNNTGGENYYDVDSVVDGQDGPVVWMKYNEGVEGNNYYILRAYINCEGRWFQEIEGKYHVNGKLISETGGSLQKGIVPGSSMEQLLAVVCKKKWKFWK